MKFHALRVFLLVAAGICGASFAQAQDVVLDVRTTVGTASPISGTHTVASGSEVILNAGAKYRVIAVPTVLDSGQVRLAVRIFDAASNSSAPVSSPVILIAPGQEATMAQGTEPPDEANLKIQITPRLK